MDASERLIVALDMMSDEEVFPLVDRLGDVPKTIRSYISLVVDRGVSFVTVHGVGAVIEAAREGAGDSDLKILCVTVLTSFDQDDIRAMYGGVDESVEDRAVRMARLGDKNSVAT